MKSGVLARTLLGAIVSISLLTFGCSSDNSGPATKADAGKKDTGANGGAGGSGGSSARGGSGGSGGSSASGGAGGSGGGSGGSSASGGSGGSAGSGGTSASGGSAGSSNAGGSAGGSGGSGGAAGSGGGSGTGGIGGTGGTNADAGNVQFDGGGNLDTGFSDALDAPLLGDDGAASETGTSDDGGAPIRLDTGTQDSEAIDTTVVFLDAEADTSVADVAADSAADIAPDTADAGTCLQQIISNGYAFLPANPCSQCQDTTQPSHPDLHSQCQDMIDCLVAASCQSSSNNCWLTCRNSVSGNQIATETCVAALVTAACH